MSPESHLLHDARHWQMRASEARAVASGLDDAEARRMMLEIAESYEALARRAAIRDRETPGKG